MQTLMILGSTGSIGRQTLDVVRSAPDHFDVKVLAANTQVKTMYAQCVEFKPACVYMENPQARDTLKSMLKENGHSTIEVLPDYGALLAWCASDQFETLVAGIVGSAGLMPTFTAAKAGKRILLANKESLVMAGSLLMNTVHQHGATILPLDSEHNAIFQALPDHYVPGHVLPSSVHSIVLTASGGALLRHPLDAMNHVTPEQAVAHPNWSMGAKISVDSATLMNKGLELIEASFLFNLPGTAIDIVVHPQSIVHSMVYYRDGSVLAQLANPDMRVPIAYGLAFPDRMTSGAEALDLTRQPALEFSKPDVDRFPCVSLGRAALEAGGTAPAVLNAANEIAVAAFLSNRLGFQQIPAIIEAVLSKTPCEPAVSLDIIQGADSAARIAAKELI